MNNKTVDKKIIIIAFIAAILAIIGFYVLAVTYARYTSDVSRQATTQIAKWDFSDNGVDNFAFRFSSTINPDSLAQYSSGNYYIAPGTNGTLQLDVSNTSDVGVEVIIDIGDLMIFDIDQDKYVPLEDSDLGRVAPDIVFTSMSGTTNKLGTINKTDGVYKFYLAIPGSQYVSADSITAVWSWEFSGDDEKDTAIGESEYTREDIIIPVSITGTQVNPNQPVKSDENPTGIPYVLETT